MRFRYKGDGDLDGEGNQKPCAVFGHTFVAGEWESVDLPLAQAAKLAGNPAFDTDGVSEAVEPTRPEGWIGQAVDIPQDWAKLPFLKQRSIASKIETLADGAKKPQVVAIIEAELARRAGPEPDPQSTDA